MTNFRTSKELVNFLKKKGYVVVENKNIATLEINSKIKIDFDLIDNKFSIDGIKADRTTIFNLTNPENHSVVMLLIKLLQKGYDLSTITLEKSWQTGHSPIYLDVMLHNQQTNGVFMIEVKEYYEYLKYTDIRNDKKIKQLCSYAMQEQTTEIASFYTYNFAEEKDFFANIYCKDWRRQTLNFEDFFDRWNKIFDRKDYIFNNAVFNIKQEIKTYKDLKNINENDTKVLFNQFLTILRLNSVSDKPTAFMKMINLFLAKLADEITENKEFNIKDRSGNSFRHIGMEFQYVENETPESFMKRLNGLYKEGMFRYLRKEIIDYSDSEIEALINRDLTSELMKAFDDLRLKNNNNFSFIEIYNETTFLENFEIVKDIVKILENYKLKYETKHQFLGDFFEELLNTSLKQEAGQFFTPYPIVDFMVNSLNFEQKINENISNRNSDFIPSIIDYACGAGHFLISAMSSIQKIIVDLEETNLTTTQTNKIRSYKENPYSWADGKKIVGIEKDYRLAKTTKIASFLNGDGDAEIIAGDGINKFDCQEYKQTILYSTNNRNEIFDYVISNPPYSVDGFMLNFRKNGIDKKFSNFSLLTDEINSKDSAIEIFFVERMEQLLKNGGIGAIILPQSILSQDKYEKMRTFLFDNFKIISMVLTADITFSGTTTSPVILFLRKEKIDNKNYEVLVHQSPKYSMPTGTKLKSKEIKFLGYEFSSNRSKSGIAIVNDSILSNLSSATKEFLKSGTTTIQHEFTTYSKIVKMNDILINVAENYCGDIYPKRVIATGQPLSNFCKINEWQEEDFANAESPSQYLEIGDINTQIPNKSKKTNRFCKKGDILVSALTPKKDKIVIAKDNFMLSTAIHVLSSFENEDIKDKIYNELIKEQTLKQMNALLDGFKVTYAKISEKNLYNNIFIFS